MSDGGTVEGSGGGGGPSFQEMSCCLSKRFPVKAIHRLLYPARLVPTPPTPVPRARLPAPRLSRADVTQLPSTSLTPLPLPPSPNQAASVGVPSRRHPTCEAKRGDGGGGYAAWEHCRIFRTPSTACPRATHLFRTLRRWRRALAQHLFSSSSPRPPSPPPPPLLKKETLSSGSPEMTPPAGLWNILIPFSNSYYGGG